MRRSAAVAAPSPTATPCACLSASGSPGNAARRRGCRRSRPTTPDRRVLGGGGRRGRLEVGALDLARLVDLEHVAFLDVVEALEQDPALEAFLDLAHVVLEALQLRDPRFVDHGAVAHYAHVRVSAHGAARDVRAGDRAEARDPEQLAHLDLAERALLRDRL